MPIYNNNTKQKWNYQPGNLLGNLYGGLRGFNPFGMLRNFGTNFKTSAGIPQDAKLWNSGSGIQLGNLPIQNYLDTYSLGNPIDTTEGLTGKALKAAKAQDLIANNNLKQIFNTPIQSGIDAQGVTVEGLKNLPEGVNIDELVKGGYVNKTSTPTTVTPGKGTSLGSLANVVGGIYQGGKAIGALNESDSLNRTYDDLVRDIKLSATSNPMYSNALSASQKKLMRQIKSGTAKNDVGNVISGIGKGIPNVLMNAGAGFLTGGIPGALIQGLGTAVNKGIEGYNTGSQESIGQLQALYDQLQNAEQEYQRMRRPYGLVNSGLQSRYYDQLW